MTVIDLPAGGDLSAMQLITAPIAALPDELREGVLADTLDRLSEDELTWLMSWEGQRRPTQVIDPVDDKPLVCLLGGRGSGKTRGGAEGICDRIEADMMQRGAFVSRTPGDVRRVQLEGVGGFFAACDRRGIRYLHTPSRTEIDIVDGGIINTFSAHQPEALRGPEFSDAWADEFAAWPQKVDELGGTAFSNLLLALRLGAHPLGIFTTTPRAVPAVREIVNDKTGLWRLSRMATAANASNLAPGFLGRLLRMFGGSRLYAQEVLGHYIEDVEGALWSTARIADTRLVPADWDVDTDGMTETDVLQAKIALVERIAGGLPWRYVAVDPSFAEDGGGDECGIVVGGVGADRRFYVLGDYSGHLAPEDWARRVSWAYQTASCASAVVEGNGDKYGIRRTLEQVDKTMPIEFVIARTGKRARAEPVATLWRDDPTRSLGIVVGDLHGLEAEMTGWDGRSNVSPNRIDALAWLGWRCFDHLYEQEASWSSESGGYRLPQ